MAIFLKRTIGLKLSISCTDTLDAHRFKRVEVYEMTKDTRSHSDDELGEIPVLQITPAAVAAGLAAPEVVQPVLHHSGYIIKNKVGRASKVKDFYRILCAKREITATQKKSSHNRYLVI